MRYEATRNGMGHLTIHRVPIFVECERGDMKFDAAWIAEAVKKARQAESEGYFPPLHIRHHDDGAMPQPVGFFKIVETGPMTFKGKERIAIFADLVVTQPHVEDDVLKARLPYRSVEIFNVDDPAINSLALLDHEPPYLELPMLMVTAAEPGIAGEPGLTVPTSGQLVSVASATFVNPWRSEGYQKAEPVVACFRHGTAAHFLTQDIDMTTTDEKKTEAEAAQFADDEKKNPFESGDPDPAGTAAAEMGVEPKEGEEEPAAEMGEPDDGDEDMIPGEEGEADPMEDAMSDTVKSLCETIRTGAISVADLEQLKQAIIEILGGGEETAPEQDPQQAQAPAPTPGEAMTKKNEEKKPVQIDEKFAALSGENAALKARLDEKDEIEAARKDVADAVQRLEGRPFGSDREAKLEAYRTEHGAAAFKSYVDSMVATFAEIGGGGDEKAAAFAAQGATTSKVALAYTEHGTDAVNKAASFAAEHKELAEKGCTRTSEERYVALNMSRLGFEAPSAK